jgi:hypothetical protein
MDQVLGALGDLVQWMEDVTPLGPLAALLLLAAGWLAARRATRWTAALLAAGAGMVHWSHVVSWRGSPQSPHFHRTVVALFVAMPFAVLLIAAVGALLRRRVMRRPSVAVA